jgi:radical SAM superfamily enzyme YgiQ (UPF0313 family)
MKRNILLVRTHLTLSAGGPVPPLGLLHIAGAIYRAFGDEYAVRLVDTGTWEYTPERMAALMRELKPWVVGLSALTCEAELLHQIAGIAKAVDPETHVVVGGSHATLAKEQVLRDPHVDVVAVGESDETIVELLEALDGKKDLGTVQGIVYRRDARPLRTPPRMLLSELDSLIIPPKAWDLIDVYEYGKYSNWNGARKEKNFLPVMSSRGCPFSCTFCRSKDNFGMKFRTRSDQSFVDEVVQLSDRFGIHELHFFDDVFNFHKDRAKRICQLLEKTGRKWNISFPNGLRADLLDESVLTGLKGAGTYKIHYGIESGSPRVLKMIKKDLELDRAQSSIAKTVAKKIIASGYFILGFPTETREEMQQTIDFAANSRLDNAYFFKFNDFLGYYYQNEEGKGGVSQQALQEADLHFFSPNDITQQMPKEEINVLLLEAQHRFYLNFRRVARGFLVAPEKWAYVKNLVQTFAIILTSFLLKRLQRPAGARGVPQERSAPPAPPAGTSPLSRSAL